MFEQNILINLKKFIFLCLLILPISIASGPFFPDLLLVILSVYFIFISVTKKLWSYYNNIYCYLYFVFCFYIILRSFFSIMPSLSYESSLFYFRYFFFICAVCYLILNENNTLRFFHYFLLVSILFLCFDAIFQYYFSFNFFGFKIKDPTSNWQISGLFRSEQILGSFLARLYPLLISYLCLKSILNKKTLFAYLTVSLIIGITILFSGERTAIFIFLSYFFLFIFLTKKLRFFSMYFIFIFIISSFLLFTYHPNVKNRIIDQTFQQIGLFKSDTQDKNLYLFTFHHEEHFVSAYKVFKDNILFGVGPKIFRVICKEDKYYSESGCSTHPHNTYLQLLSETGILGTFPVLFIFLVVFFYFIKQFINLYFKNIILYDEYIIVLLTSLFLNLFPFIPSSNFFGNKISIFYYFPIGFIVAKYMLNNHSFYNISFNNENK